MRKFILFIFIATFTSPVAANPDQMITPDFMKKCTYGLFEIMGDLIVMDNINRVRDNGSQTEFTLNQNGSHSYKVNGKETTKLFEVCFATYKHNQKIVTYSKEEEHPK